MNRRQVKEAIHSGKPFIIRMADGECYHVAHEDFVASTQDPTVIIVIGNGGETRVLPLITMTGITFPKVLES